MTLTARLFTRPGCHLCTEAAANLRRLRRRHPHALELVDITSDPVLEQEYGQRIPVLALAGREYDAPLPTAVLERALREAQSSATQYPRRGGD
jgi:hypothetical protein